MANKKGLGRGIEALFADNQVSENNIDENVIEIPLTKLIPNPYQPRLKFDAQALDDLTRSIKKNGVFQPIIVRKLKPKADKYEIIAGERRFRASKKANRKSIPAIVRAATNPQMMEIAVMENLQRENLTPLEEAEAYNTLMTKLDITQSEVSKRLGKSRSYIANYLRLLGLPNEVKEMLEKRQLSMGQARTLLSIHNKDDLVKLARKVANKALTVREIQTEIDQLNHHPKKRTAKKRKSPAMIAHEEMLEDHLKTKVSINNRRGHGKIEINYKSKDDLDRILKLLHIN
ncbi:chromosome partitioning protein ParB [Philodulcilactobacillus myokoensis]|uniref:Chromosome partitioning protein ParB n=1 Tax=Philodulcilactobacillus myokoensis TaxID=2929573 RepID=A0A9W6ESP2_9LACO|nr:ParB/RepB/Spo0J family partition protein [Philodulcilactobacillus myokoensis]GLB47256.1 chromosome partitioning protein ParB [Philodulcilactobacillus myokoensis]